MLAAVNFWHLTSCKNDRFHAGPDIACFESEQVNYLIEVLQNRFIVGGTAKGSSLELNAIDILLLWLLQLYASMEAICCFCKRVAEAGSPLQVTGEISLQPISYTSTIFSTQVTHDHLSVSTDSNGECMEHMVSLQFHILL